MPPDLIVYALIAAGLVFWLRNVLGTRHEDEGERPNPYSADNTPTAPTTGQDSMLVTEDQRSLSAHELIEQLAEEPKGAMIIGNKTAEMGLIDIAKIDRNFNVVHFLEGAQDAFVIIVESFAEGDCETLENLLDKPVYEAFEAVITARAEKEEIHESEIHAIKKAEIIEARVHDKMAYITVNITADETGIARDKEGEIILGHPDQVSEMRDIWVFGREIKSRDPRWFLYETRGEFEGDNETLPNSH